MFEGAAAISSSKLREHLHVKYDAISTQHPDNVVMISHKKIAPAEWTFVMDVALLRVGDCYLSKKNKKRKKEKEKNGHVKFTCDKWKTMRRTDDSTGHFVSFYRDRVTSNFLSTNFLLM